MVDKPLSSELEPQEIEQINKSLESHTRRSRLKKTQKVVIDFLGNKPEIKRYISNIRPREEIKVIDSVIEKINDHRRNSETYNIADVRDLIGAQIICPYPDCVTAILDWLYSRSGGKRDFQIITNIKEVERKRKEREDRTGYRAYHVCLKLKPNAARINNLPVGDGNEQFELQIKTALDAGWDFKTHDITYKAIVADPHLQHHMKLISDSLGSIDKQTLLLRDLIIEEQNIRRELREAACRLIFYRTLDKKQKGKLGINKVNIEQLQEYDIKNLEHTLQKYHQRKGIDITYTVGLALIALCCNSRLKQEESLSCASYLVNQAEGKAEKEDYISSLRTRALLRWAFHKTRHAVDDMRYLMQVTKELCDINDYVYYVSELYEPTDEDIQLVEQGLKKLKSSKRTQYKDTLGAYYIRFGENIEQIRHGLSLVREAKEEAQNDTILKPVLDAFCSYHEYIFLRQLSKRQRIL